MKEIINNIKKHLEILGLILISLFFILSTTKAFEAKIKYEKYKKINNNLKINIERVKKQKDNIKLVVNNLAQKEVINSKINADFIANNEIEINKYINSIYKRNYLIFLDNIKIKNECKKNICFLKIKLSGEKFTFYDNKE
ncbi:hypothetical protein [Thermodesulfatator autotrophicus]|uniref:Uncharacterized protein n=1 Tax=Thermodesulfatator autotrophicus TaxID=1795632 RepID=A0A177E9Z3_9BACT|nr:hypothetical protein [Thermodesulfatator autotrophicus]OAG28618.1 hypothetical protein TH606_00525 [Thermodesulfatator autotrophicus]